MAVNIALPLNEVEAAPVARAVFAEAREALRTPFTPGLIRSLAQWPAYLASVWEQLRPSIETAGFRGSAQYLAAMAREAVDQFYEATYGRDTLLDSGLSESDIDAIAGGLEVLHLTNPQCLLIAGALTEALERPRVGGMGRPEPRDISEEERRILAYEWTMLDEGEMSADIQRLAADAREVLGLPFLTDDFRFLARWPEFLDLAWGELRELRVYKLFRQRGRGLYFYARSSAKFLARPLEASVPQLGQLGLTDGDIAGIGETLRMFCGILPNHIMNVATMQSALGIRPVLPPPPQPRKL